MTLLRNADPFRDFDRLAQHLLGTTNRPVVMPMDACREADRFVIEFDLPGVDRESIDLDVERNVPVAEKAKPRKIRLDGGAERPDAIAAR